MKIVRVPASRLAAFETFSHRRLPEFLDIQTKDGDLSVFDDLPEQGFAIVGSRDPQKRSLDLVESVMRDLKSSKLVVVSGFARGIDSHAHATAINEGLRTIAFLGCGIQQTYPRENAHLRRLILENGGALISAFPVEASPLPRNFHERNALIAGFSKAVWVVEAAEVSGTLNTATWAQKFSRDLYATACFPTDYFYQGNVKLLSERETHRYPVAAPLFGADSLSPTYGVLAREGDTQTEMVLAPRFRTEIQNWVLILKTECGVCTVQNLMNYASEKGHTLGSFYLQYEKELNEGKLKQDAQGLVEALI